MTRKVSQLIEVANEKLNALTLTEHRRLTMALFAGAAFLFLGSDLLRHVLQFAGVAAGIATVYVGYQLLERENRDRYAGK
jgi:hypothetical protein